jgi:hypothetical protein
MLIEHLPGIIPTTAILARFFRSTRWISSRSQRMTKEPAIRPTCGHVEVMLERSAQ